MATMQAVVLTQPGSLEHLKLDTVVVPKPGVGEVLVEVMASALNHRDVWIVQGRYPNIKTPVILGSDGVGIIREVGEGVDPSCVGRQVMINPSLNWGNNPRVQSSQYKILGLPDNGTQAEYVVVPIQNVVDKPEHLTMEEAAAIPLGGLTGYRALFTQGKLQAGETVLLTGIGGGVATLMLKMALAAGARVLVTSGSDEKIKKAVNLGALGGANYKEDGWGEKLMALAEPNGIDLIVDSAGGDGFFELTRIVNPGGRIVFFGATAGNPSKLDQRRMFWKQITLQGTTMGTPQDFSEMVRLFDVHKLKPPIDRVFPLTEFRSAYLRMWKSEQFGKIVLRHTE